MRQLLAALATLLPLAAHASPDAAVSEIWDRFETACLQALSDPHGYLAAQQIPPEVQRTPDGQVAMVYGAPMVHVQELVEIAVMGEMVHLSCDVSAVLDGLGAAEIAAAFEALAKARGVPLVGGQTEFGMLLALGNGPPDFQPIGPLYPYYTRDFWQDTDATVIIRVEEAGLSLFAAMDKKNAGNGGSQ